MERRKMVLAILASPLALLRPKRRQEERTFYSVERGDLLWRAWLDCVDQGHCVSCKTGRNGWVKRYVDFPNSITTETVRGHVTARFMTEREKDHIRSLPS